MTVELLLATVTRSVIERASDSCISIEKATVVLLTPLKHSLAELILQLTRTRRRKKKKEERYFCSIDEDSQKRKLSSLIEEVVESEEEFETEDLFGISDERDLIYDAVVDLTVINSSARNHENQEDIDNIRRSFPNKGEEIPDDVDCLLCNHDNEDCTHLFSQLSVNKTEVTLVEESVLLCRKSEEIIEDKEAAVQDNTNSSFEEHDCINLCNSDDDIPSSEHAIDQLKTDFVKPVVVEEPVFINTARLNSNESNSCYIDAPFEMLFRCVLPYVKQLFSSLYDECNAFDKVLFEAFYKYVDGDVVAGSQLVREFVWKESTEFVKGDWNCVYSCFHWFLSNTSSRLRSLFCVYPHYELNMCLEQKEELQMKQIIPDALPFIKGNYQAMKQYFAARQIKDQEAKKKKMGELKIQFEEVYRRELLYKTRESSGCNSCGKQCAFKSG